MPPDFGQAFANDWFGQPPHMSSLDTPLWERFQRLRGSEFLFFYFDVALGTAAPPLTDITEAELKMWKRLTSKRIDAVGVKENEWWIIEMRPRAAAGALGTVLTYRSAWLKDPPDNKFVRTVIVSDVFDPDIIDNAAELNIELIVV